LQALSSRHINETAIEVDHETHYLQSIARNAYDALEVREENDRSEDRKEER
jgi:hypothetical protein